MLTEPPCHRILWEKDIDTPLLARETLAFLCTQRASSTHFPLRSLPAEHAAGTLSPVWDILSFLHFLFYFISCSMILPQCPQGPPSLPFAHLNHQQSPARKLPRGTLVVSSSVEMFSCFCLPQFQILPDSSRQRFILP